MLVLLTTFSLKDTAIYARIIVMLYYFSHQGATLRQNDGQSGFSRYAFLSDYLTNLKLHKTKQNTQKLPSVRFEPMTS